MKEKKELVYIVLVTILCAYSVFMTNKYYSTKQKAVWFIQNVEERFDYMDIDLDPTCSDVDAEYIWLKDELNK